MSAVPSPRVGEAEAIRRLVDLVLMDPDPRTPEHTDSEIAAAQIAYGWTKRLPEDLSRKPPVYTGTGEAREAIAEHAELSRPLHPKRKRPKQDPPELVAAKSEIRWRSQGVCEASIEGVCAGQAVHAHHVLRRSQGGKHTAENLLDLSDGCHQVIHANPEWAKRHGFLRSPGGPLIAPVAGCSLSCDVDHRPVTT